MSYRTYNRLFIGKEPITPAYPVFTLRTKADATKRTSDYNKRWNKFNLSSGGKETAKMVAVKKVS